MCSGVTAKRQQSRTGRSWMANCPLLLRKGKKPTYQNCCKCPQKTLRKTKYKRKVHCTETEYESSDYFWVPTILVRSVSVYWSLLISTGTFYLYVPLYLFLVIYINLKLRVWTWRPEVEKHFCNQERRDVFTFSEISTEKRCSRNRF